MIIQGIHRYVGGNLPRFVGQFPYQVLIAQLSWPLVFLGAPLIWPSFRPL